MLRAVQHIGEKTTAAFLQKFATRRATSIYLWIRRDINRSCTSVISGSSEESRAGGGDAGKLGVKKPRPKASSPNRQGPQQCQVRNYW